MKTIALLGGMSWESTIVYYQLINEQVRARLGGLHSAKILMNSFDFAEIVELQQTGRWEEASDRLRDAASQMVVGGADMVLICTNTMHKVAEDIQEALSVPLVHIADATAEAIKQQGLRKVGLLGTKYTMEQDFYSERLASHGIEVIVPDAAERETVNQVIFGELCQGVIESSSRARYQEIIKELVMRGAEGVILGCTEIPLLIQQAHCPVPLFDTTCLHAVKAVEMALA